MINARERERGREREERREREEIERDIFSVFFDGFLRSRESCLVEVQAIVVRRVVGGSLSHSFLSHKADAEAAKGRGGRGEFTL